MAADPVFLRDLAYVFLAALLAAAWRDALVTARPGLDRYAAWVIPGTGRAGRPPCGAGLREPGKAG
jgi:hypothetical protein